MSQTQLKNKSKTTMSYSHYRYEKALPSHMPDEDVEVLLQSTKHATDEAFTLGLRTYGDLEFNTEYPAYNTLTGYFRSLGTDQQVRQAEQCIRDPFIRFLYVNETGYIDCVQSLERKCDPVVPGNGTKWYGLSSDLIGETRMICCSEENAHYATCIGLLPQKLWPVGWSCKGVPDPATFPMPDGKPNSDDELWAIEFKELGKEWEEIEKKMSFGFLPKMLPVVAGNYLPIDLWVGKELSEYSLPKGEEYPYGFECWFRGMGHLKAYNNSLSCTEQAISTGSRKEERNLFFKNPSPQMLFSEKINRGEFDANVLDCTSIYTQFCPVHSESMAYTWSWPDIIMSRNLQLCAWWVEKKLKEGNRGKVGAVRGQNE